MSEDFPVFIFDDPPMACVLTRANLTAKHGDRQRAIVYLSYTLTCESWPLKLRLFRRWAIG